MVLQPAGEAMPGTVRVIVRVRPLLPSERRRGEASVVRCADPKSVSVVMGAGMGGEPPLAPAALRR